MYIFILYYYNNIYKKNDALTSQEDVRMLARIKEWIREWNEKKKERCSKKGEKYTDIKILLIFFLE